MIEMNWNVSAREAAVLQKELAAEVRIEPLPEEFGILGSADLSYLPAPGQSIAVVLTFRWPSLELLETVHAVVPTRFPYIPGLLSFREVPPLLEACGKLENPPEVFLCDGQGIAHPRGIGLASHVGLCLGIPSVGCAKSRLCGSFEPFELKRGNHAPLEYNGKVVGSVYCTRTGVKPVYISPGHKADLESSRRLVEKCLGRFRIPEPLRQAHNHASRVRVAVGAGVGMRT
jgi:deoxyribonuclease V